MWWSLTFLPDEKEEDRNRTMTIITKENGENFIIDNLRIEE